MDQNSLQKGISKPSRLIFMSGEKPPSLSEGDRKQAEKVAKGATEKAHEKAKSSAINKGKNEALAEVKHKPGENIPLPEIPKKLSGLKVDSKEAKVDHAKGTIEQPFKFGDFNIKGKLIMPEKPDPTKPVTYLFNYVEDPEKFDNGKFVDELKKRKDQLGNTVIITLKTPEGETMVDRKKVNTMSALIGDIELFQADLSLDLAARGLKLPRAEKILHMTSAGEAPKVQALLRKYAQAVADKDPRALQIKQIINNDPDNFSANLDKALNPPEPTPQVDQAPQQSPAVGGGSFGGAPSASPGHGGVGGGGGGASPSAGPSDTPTDSPAATTTANPPVDSSPESKEAYNENLNKLLVLGDSLMTGAQGRLKANEYTKLDQQAVGGWSVAQILGKFRQLEAQGRLEKYRHETLVMNGGVNDIAGGRSAEQILEDMKRIWELAAKFNMKVYCCTLSPFKGASGWKDSLRNGYEEKEKIRQTVNDQLIAIAGTPGGPTKIIPLHRSVSEGGLADDHDLSALAPQYAAGDKLHMKPKGYAQMAKTIQNIIGQPTSPEAKIADTNSKTAAPGKIEGFKVSSADVKAADRYLAEVKASANPTARIGEIKILPGNPDKILRVAWHPNHTGQWGTPSYRITSGRHIGVQVEPNPDNSEKA